MSLSSAKAKLDAQGGDPVTGYISKTDHQESYDELVDDTALTGSTTAEALDVTGALTAGTIASDATVAGTGLAGGLLSSANPVINGVAAPGTSAIPSRQDHVHASDTTKVTGPASATDNALVRFDGTGGKTVQNSGITVDDSGNVSSDLTVSKASAVIQATATGGTAASVRVSGDAGTLRDFAFYTGANSRWFFRCDNVAESGSDAGSNFVITQKLDSGASPSYYAFTINRATGKATLGSVGATAGLELGSSGPRVMSGTGSPEGVVSAPVNSKWIRTDATTLGDFEYTKLSGTGNIGWKVTTGDTGLRYIQGSLENGWTAAGVGLRRNGNTVWLSVAAAAPVSASSDTFYTLPVGYRSAGYYGGAINVGTLSDGKTVQIHYSTGALYVPSRGVSALSQTMAISWLTADAWPTSLPGTTGTAPGA